MKKKILACAVSAGMLISALPIGSFAAFAEDTALTNPIPQSLEETIDFLNLYGSTHIEDDVICVIFEESMNDIYSYEAVSTDDSCIVSREIYENQNIYGKYEVIAYRPKTAGEFNVELNRYYNNSSVYKDASYTFFADDSGKITETDIYGTFPDCITEYKDFINEYGIISNHGDYIAYCGDINYSCGHSLIMEQNGTAEIEQIAVSYCGWKSLEADPPGTTSHNVYIYQAVSDGTVDVSWKVGREWDLENSMVSNIEKKYDVNDGVFTETTIGDDTEQNFEIIGNSVYFSDSFFLGYDANLICDIEFDSDNDQVILTPKSDGSYFVMLAEIVDEKRTVEGGDHIHYSYFDFTNYMITVKDGIPSVEKNGTASTYSNYDIQEYLDDYDYRSVCSDDDCLGELDLNFNIHTILSYLNGKIAYNTDKYFFSVGDTNGSMDMLVLKNIDESTVTVDRSRLHVATVESSSSISDDFTIATPDWFTNAVIGVGFSFWESVEDGAALFTVNNGDSSTCYAIDLIHDNFVHSTLRVVDQSVKGDLNGDGELTIADAVILQNWLTNASEADLINWKAADLCADDRLDVYDFCLMKQELLKS